MAHIWGTIDHFRCRLDDMRTIVSADRLTSVAIIFDSTGYNEMAGLTTDRTRDGRVRPDSGRREFPPAGGREVRVKRSKGQDRRPGPAGRRLREYPEFPKNSSATCRNFPTGAACTNLHALCAICTLHNQL